MNVCAMMISKQRKGQNVVTMHKVNISMAVGTLTLPLTNWCKSTNYQRANVPVYPLAVSPILLHVPVPFRRIGGQLGTANFMAYLTS